MKKEYLRYFWSELRCIKLFPRRYGTEGKPQTEAYWRGVIGRYNNMMKLLNSSDYHWRIIEYDDGNKELAYLRVLQGGLLSGLYPAIYRGLIIPRRVRYDTFSHVRRIRLAF